MLAVRKSLKSHRGWRARRWPTGAGKNLAVWRLLAFLVALILLIIFLDHQIHPLVKSFGENQAKFTSTKAINEAVTQVLTDEQIRLCYQSGKKISEGENVADLADEIVAATGMNRNSAIIYLNAVNSMLNGKVYKRAINISATGQYFDWIFNEYGVKGIQRALKATQLHINYRKECGHTVDSLEELYERYARRF